VDKIGIRRKVREVQKQRGQKEGKKKDRKGERYEEVHMNRN
jgi:hypothetical protein